MYTELNLNEVASRNFDNFKLCYVERLQKYDFDDNGNEIELFDDNEEHLELFFTNCDMKEQWGDDWDDVPYECNAGWPYDDHYEGDKRISHEIIRLKLTLKTNNGNGCGYYYHLPEDFAFNSQFSVEMINAGVVAWLSISLDRKEIGHGSNYLIIHGGESLPNIIGKLDNFIKKSIS